MRVRPKYFQAVFDRLCRDFKYCSGRGSAAGRRTVRWKFEVGEKLDYNMVQEMDMSAAAGPAGS